MDIKKPQLVKVEAFVNFFNGSSATPSYLIYEKHIAGFGGAQPPEISSFSFLSHISEI